MRGCVLGGGVVCFAKVIHARSYTPGGYLFFVIFIQNIHKITFFQLFKTNFHILDKKIFLMIIMCIYINKNYHSFHLRGVVNKTIQFFQNENPCSQSNPTTPNPHIPSFSNVLSLSLSLFPFLCVLFFCFSFFLFLVLPMPNFPSLTFLYYICLFSFTCLTLIFIYDTIKLIFYNY